jgi:hypothetical protein
MKTPVIVQKDEGWRGSRKPEYRCLWLAAAAAGVRSPRHRPATSGFS